MANQRTQSDRQKALLVSLTALGVVYGDIGTSPLYALRECFLGKNPIPPNPSNVLGVLSLIFWALLLVVSVKYLVYVMRADNHGEGGILALLALLNPWRRTGRSDRKILIVLGVFGAALLYGDGAITPAISVLSALEGLKVATPVLEPYVVPITVAILVLLFCFQGRGTAGVGSVFGPVMLVWFATIAVLGITGIARRPDVLAAVNPAHAVVFFVQNGWVGFTVLGAVFLVVTGGEALYADMGHFGPTPIRHAWFVIVLPALVLNYFGQGALLLDRPDETAEPFYHLAPAWAVYPLVALAAVSTIIASQAVITGAFSLTRQAILLGESPRLRIIHTSPEEVGQIYIPLVNWTLMLTTIALVIGFGSSSSLAGAYGVAVSTTMVITTILAGVLAAERWGWNLLLVGVASVIFLAVDLSFFTANLLKIDDGGWFPLVVGLAIHMLMSTWKLGHETLDKALRARTPSMHSLLIKVERDKPHRVPGTAVFMTSLGKGGPPMLWHHLKHNQVLHNRVLLVTVQIEDVPWISADQRVEVQEIGANFYRVVGRFGFMQIPHVPALLRACKPHGLDVDPQDVTYYVGRETLIPVEKLGIPLWREKIFAFLSRNQARATQFYRIPPSQVVELGIQVEI